ncbi:MAG: hypothetical protein WC426_13635 [Sulfuriferula sp.]
MNLANILNGTEKVGKHSSITFNGQVYRGEKAIKELARKTVGNSQEVVTNDRPATASTKPRTRNTRSRASKPANDNSAGSTSSTPGSDGGSASE